MDGAGRALRSAPGGTSRRTLPPKSTDYMTTNPSVIAHAGLPSHLLYPTGDTTRSRNHEWFGEGRLPDFPWVVNGSSRDANTLESLTDIFAWEDSPSILAGVGLLDCSVCIRRLRSSLDHIGLYDSALSKSMRDSYEGLPPQARARFALAPETFSRISLLRKEPATAIVSLCSFLNAESALFGGDGVLNKPQWTALGDYYLAGSPLNHMIDSERPASWCAGESFCAPRLAGMIPVDFFSPNLNSALDPLVTVEHLEYSPEEVTAVFERLTAALDCITRVSEAAGRLIRDFIKVIVPRKIAKGNGSTSQPHYPGRVLLRNVETTALTRVAGYLVHEAIHQLLYPLEYAGRFVIRNPDPKSNVRVASYWTGRGLELHSFVHACFVWYGLANFWVRARDAGVFDPEGVDRELRHCLSGFRGPNPVDVLKPYAGLIRCDYLIVAGTLQGRLKEVMDGTPAQRN